jgi:hypothetical protein
MQRALGLALLLACGAGPPAQKPAEPTQTDAPRKIADSPEAKQPEPFATPKAAPPPPPDGAVVFDPPLYVQRCDPAHACPKLQQPAGETHCRELKLGGHTGWRLPDRAEAKRFTNDSIAKPPGPVGLNDAEGFHWTRTAFAEDAAQAWIVDPKSGQETTIPRTRKPFTIRCVLDP